MNRTTAYRRPVLEGDPDLRLDANEGLGPAADALAAWGPLPAESVRRYPDAAPLERALAAAWGLDPARVLVTAGADDALERACRVFLGPGDAMVLPRPTFTMLERYGQRCRATLLQPDWTSGPWPVDAVLAATEDPAVIAAVTPNNPTGLAAEPGAVERVARARPGSAVLLDAAYVEFAGADPTRAALAEPNVLVFRTFSKAWGLAGLRVGYVMGAPEWIERLRAMGQPYPVAQPALDFAEAWLGSGSRVMEAFVARVRAERDTLTRFLRERGHAVEDSAANFVFLRHPRAHALRDALAERGIAVRAWDEPALADALRITCPGEAPAFERLTAALEDLP